MRVRWVLAIAAAAMAVAVPAAGAEVPRQIGSITYTSTVPGSPTGNVLDLVFQNPDDPANGKPYSAMTMIVHGPPGGVIDTTVPPQCHASDPEIYALGFDACPADTRIGSGYVVAEPGPGSESTTTIQDFNNQDEIVGIGVNNDFPVIKSIDRTQLRDGTSTSHFPLLPGFPPPEPYTAFKHLHAEFPVYTRDGRTYNRTPPKCPRVGYWNMTVDVIYRDGVTQSFDSHSPCQHRRAGGTVATPGA